MSGFSASYPVGGEVDRVGRLSSGRLDYPFMPTKTAPYVKGFLLQVNGAVQPFDQVWTPEFDIELVSVAVGASIYKTRDNWSMFIGDATLPQNCMLETIYTKDIPEGVYLMAVKTVKAGTPITFRFQNESGTAKHVWINFQCLKDEPPVPTT